MTELVGIIGAILLAGCAIPEVARSYRRGYCDLGWGFLLTWLLGEIFVFIYVLLTSLDLILLANYGGNIGLILILIRYTLKRNILGDP